MSKLRQFSIQRGFAETMDATLDKINKALEELGLDAEAVVNIVSDERVEVQWLTVFYRKPDFIGRIIRAKELTAEMRAADDNGKFRKIKAVHLTKFGDVAVFFVDETHVSFNAQDQVRVVD